MEKYKIIFDNDRLGDRIAIYYFASNFKREREEEIGERIKIVALENFWHHPYIEGFSMKDWGSYVFDDVITIKNRSKWNSTVRSYEDNGFKNFERKYWNSHKLTPELAKAINNRFGNLWIYTPAYVRDFGIYPKLSIPKKYNDWVNSEYGYLRDEGRPIIAVHALLDAKYSTSRNHHFWEWKKMMIDLAKEKDYIVLRIGHKGAMVENLNGLSHNLKDFTVDDLDVSKSIALISLCDVYCGGDTGMSHAAAALDKKMMCVWGDITHMLADKPGHPKWSGKFNNIKYLDWDSSYMFYDENRGIVHRREGGEQSETPVYSSETLVESVERVVNMLEKNND